MLTSATVEKIQFASRDEIPEPYRWDLTAIFPDWDRWKAAYGDLESRVDAFAKLQGTLAQGPEALLAAFRATDAMGQMAYKIWYFASLRYDEDQRDNSISARRQEVQILLAKWQQATSWFNPELLKIPLETVRDWMQASLDLQLYRFAIEDLYRQQEHVLDEKGERLLSLNNRFESTPYDSYAALSTADASFPSLVLTTGEEVTLTYGQYRAILSTRRNQADRAEAFRRYHEMYHASLNTYASLYNGVLQRDWFRARARGYGTTLEAALHGNNIPVSVVETLIARTKAGVAPLQRYERLRQRVLGLDTYHVYDRVVPLVELEERYPYDEVLEWIVESTAPLGDEYQRRMKRAVTGRWIDVYESTGKRSGAYSAPVYGVHPYMLLNYNNTLDAVFTLAHELGHSMHTMLSHEHQPFVYADYTIFVAEVPSTLSEALFLDRMLARTDSARRRIVLLQHAIDGIASTFFTQVMFADYELQAHRLVEQGRPITADVLSELYRTLLHEYHGDVMDYDELARVTWARIPHFFNSPYYVYQYATCFASTAQLVRQIREGSAAARAEATDRYLNLLQAGGSDYPMELLKRAGVDLSEPGPVDAVVQQFDGLVTRLEAELGALAKRS
ncbi:MAG: oligoendopeptidase F [Acidobacteria bacterium]|nr:oligoendopeptidase F [Acidobacteriota bacterium]